MPLAIAALMVLGFLLLTARLNELFLVSVRDGRVLVVRGRIPIGLLQDIRDIVSKPPIARCTIRAFKEDGAARIVSSGDIDEGRAQRLRNTFRLYPLSNLRAAKPLSNPTLGQILGIAWLAWLLERR